MNQWLYFFLQEGCRTPLAGRSVGSEIGLTIMAHLANSIIANETCNARAIRHFASAVSQLASAGG